MSDNKPSAMKAVEKISNSLLGFYYEGSLASRDVESILSDFEKEIIESLKPESTDKETVLKVVLTECKDENIGIGIFARMRIREALEMREKRVKRETVEACKETLADVQRLLFSITGSYKGSVGSMYNTYLPGLRVKTVDELTKRVTKLLEDEA